MLTLFHAPQSRSSRIVTLLDELGVLEKVTVRPTSIPRRDGSGGRDPANPHPQGKVPYLVHDDTGFGESNAIVLYLTDLFPEAGLAPVVGDANRGVYLGWLAWYGNVMEPAMMLAMSGVDSPMLTAQFGTPDQITARLASALKNAPYLLGETWSAADLLIASPYHWMPDAIPDVPAIRDWVHRCGARPSQDRTARRDAKPSGG